MEKYLCFRCKIKFRTLLTPFTNNARRVPIQRMKYYEDAHTNLWLSDLVRFYLMGVEGITVNRVGQMDRDHIELWYELTENDRDAWQETNDRYEVAQQLIAAGKAAVAAGDTELEKLHQQTIMEMRAEREAADAVITDGEEQR